MSRGSLLVRMAHDGGLQCSVQTFHEAVSCGVVGGHPAEVDTTHLRQAVEEMLLEVASLFGRDCLWTSKACYPAREQGARHCLCCDVRDGEGFRPAIETVYSREAVLKSCRGS